FLYPEGQEDIPCNLYLDIPTDYEVGGLAGAGPHYDFVNFHQLVDSPFLAGRSLTHLQFPLDGIPIHIWIKGEMAMNPATLLHDIRRYSEVQLRMFGHFPEKEYHYLLVILPFSYRHGVEHHQSTVISMGPGVRMQEPKMYRSLLEICSHEFFHTWNVKALRPVDMYPYRYEGENYSRLHYVTEGVTTYYGDLMLWKGNVWDEGVWLSSVNGELARHYGMGGHDQVSLEQASFDSWVNGYKSGGAPNQRISFYTKGYLVAMLLDAEIRRRTDHQHSLDEVMREMYHRLARKARGYTKADYQGIIEELCGSSFDDFFAKMISGTASLLPALQTMGEMYGWQLMKARPESLSDYWWGLKITEENGKGAKITQMRPNSPALTAGLHLDDEIIAVNGRKVDSNWEALLAYAMQENDITLHHFHQGKLLQTSLNVPSKAFHEQPLFVVDAQRSQEQMAQLQAWRSLPQPNPVS
ncbi:MAG: PDZ domain-containing protein, partial [Bacteroidota bacterium]